MYITATLDYVHRLASEFENITVTEQVAIDMESNDNLNRQLADQEKEFYEVFLFIVNQGFQRLLSRDLSLGLSCLWPSF